jgi:uncharacterized protein YndB with AHSA1/START domain
MNWTERRRRKARRRLFLRGSIALGVGFIALALAGLTLGSERTVTGQALLHRPPEVIWRVLLDLDGLPLWRSDLSALERLPDLGGRALWREVGRQGSRVIQLAAAEPPTRLFLRATVAGVPALPARTFELAPVPGGTLVTLTERTLVRNPFRRLLYRLHPPRGGITRLLNDLDHRLSGARREVVVRPE